MYLGFQGLRALGHALPLPTARALGSALGLAAYALLGRQRRLAQTHLTEALGDALSPSQRARVARGTFRNLGRTFMEWLVLPRLSTAELKQLISCEGLEHLRGALACGNGVIAVTAHFGNWELIPVYLRSLGFEGGVLARRLRYPEYESHLIGLRGAHGVPTLARGSLKDAVTLLRANQIVGVLPDQDVDSLEGIFVTFFGRAAFTPVGPAALSLMTGAPLVPCFMARDGARFRLRIEPPVATPPTSDRAEAIARLTHAWSAVVESHIRRQPDQWVWMHRRWKTQPSAGGAQGSGLRAEGGSPEPRAQSPEPGARSPEPRPQPVLSLLLLSAFCLLPALTIGCGERSKPAASEPPGAVTPDPTAAQQMSGFTLTGYAKDGSKRWVLDGHGASADQNIVTIHRPSGTGFEPQRTAYLTASLAQVRQTDRHVRLEHDVTIHTSDGVWFFAPVLHWIPDQNQVATDLPVRMESDHFLLRGRGAYGLTQLRQFTVFREIELVLNPGDEEVAPGARTRPGQQVTITCDGPLSFDYEHFIATFEQNVHVNDPNGDLYSDTLIAYLDEQTHTIRYAEAVGRVRIQQLQNTAQSERAVYEPAIGKITLVGKPSLLIYPADAEERPRTSVEPVSSIRASRVASASGPDARSDDDGVPSVVLRGGATP